LRIEGPDLFEMDTRMTWPTRWQKWGLEVVANPMEEHLHPLIRGSVRKVLKKLEDLEA
jgi:hypothetical protein